MNLADSQIYQRSGLPLVLYVVAMRVNSLVGYRIGIAVFLLVIAVVALVDSE